MGKGDAEYLEVCRKNRNVIEYDAPGSVTHDDAEELIAFAEELRGGVLVSLRERHPGLLNPERSTSGVAAM